MRHILETSPQGGARSLYGRLVFRQGANGIARRLLSCLLTSCRAAKIGAQRICSGKINSQPTHVDELGEEHRSGLDRNEEVGSTITEELGKEGRLHHDQSEVAGSIEDDLTNGKDEMMTVPLYWCCIRRDTTRFRPRRKRPHRANYEWQIS